MIIQIHRSSAGPGAGRVAFGRLGTAPALLTAQTPAAVGHDPGPRRLCIDGVVCSRVEDRLVRYALVWKTPTCLSHPVRVGPGPG